MAPKVFPCTDQEPVPSDGVEAGLAALLRLSILTRGAPSKSGISRIQLSNGKEESDETDIKGHCG